MSVRSRLPKGWALIGVALAVVVGLFIRFALSTRLDETVEDSALLVVLKHEAGPVLDDRSLDSWLSAAQPVPESMALAAACHALLGHVGDWNMNANIVVSARPDLVRVAEMLSEGLADRDLALTLEQELLEERGGMDLNPPDVGQSAELSEGDIDEYMALRSLPPSAASWDRFVVYAVNWTESIQRLVFVDLSKFRWPDFDRVPSGYEGRYQIAGSQGSAQTVVGADCVRLAKA